MKNSSLTAEESAALVRKYNAEIGAWGRNAARQIPAEATALGIKDWSGETTEQNYRSIFDGTTSRTRRNQGEVYVVSLGIPYQAFLSSVLGVGRNHPYRGTSVTSAVINAASGGGGRRVKDPVGPVIERNIEPLADIVGENRADLNVAFISERMGPITQNFGNP